MPKMGRLNQYWAAMFAGEDVSNAPRVLANIAEALNGVTNASRRNVEQLFRDELRAALREAIEAEILSPFNGNWCVHKPIDDQNCPA